MCEKKELRKKPDGLRCLNLVSICLDLQEFISSVSYSYIRTMSAPDEEEIAQLQPWDVTLLTATWGSWGVPSTMSAFGSLN